jgi:uncharacterized protein (TIGR00725 family)
MTAIVIAVIGTGAGATATQQALAEDVVGRLAAAGATLVCGGLGGVMEAAARGAAEAGGTAIGILPGTDRADGNPHLTVALPTGLGEARNALVVRSADAVIAIGGEYGTLSEIGFALKVGTPVVGLGTWELRRDGRTDAGIIVAGSAAEAVTAALTAARTSAATRG